MEKEFETYWKQHQRSLIVKAPKEMKDDFLSASKIDTPFDWACIGVPLAVGIIVQSTVQMHNELVNWCLVCVSVILVFAFMVMIRPLFTKKKSSVEALSSIKQYYYERYHKGGIAAIDPW